jgi:NAD(P)-dependent dehydrogenase (short-subunit alcohol dehydrogenase family)
MTTKTWFITGASSGFGRAFAEHALAQGHNVVATARQVSTSRRSPIRRRIA